MVRHTFWRSVRSVGSCRGKSEVDDESCYLKLSLKASVTGHDESFRRGRETHGKDLAKTLRLV
jgi:hypothetical protein